MKRYQFAVTIGSASALFYLVMIAAPFIAARGIGEPGHKVLIYNYPLSWFLLKLGALEAIIDSATWIRVSFFSLFGTFLYAAAGFVIGWILDRMLGCRTAVKR
jgi:hypothetical protein